MLVHFSEIEFLFLSLTWKADRFHTAMTFSYYLGNLFSGAHALYPDMLNGEKALPESD